VSDCARRATRETGSWLFVFARSTHLGRRFAAAGLGEAFGQRLLDELGQTLLTGVPDEREAKEHRGAVPTL